MSEDGKRPVAEIGSLAEEPARPGAGRRAFDVAKVEQAVRLLLEGIGEDLHRTGLRETPTRVARMWEEITAGLRSEPAEVLLVFEEGHDEMVMVRDIPLYSLCEHHLLPFIGKAHVAYVPNERGQLTGLSKLARLVDGLSKQLQLQERLTAEIAEALMRHLDPRGVMVVIEAEHLCMSMRGVRNPGAITVTSAVRGEFRDSMSTRMEAMNLIGVTRLG
jgi:GTP cyclohydrolase I